MTLVAREAFLLSARHPGLLVGIVGVRTDAVTLLDIVPLDDVPLAPAAPLPLTVGVSLGASGGGQIP